jgi:uncharacterized phage protein (TIGR01671 family)
MKEGDIVKLKLNMENLKFRFWDKENKRMGTAHDFFHLGNQLLECFNAPERYEVMQFIGTCDKNKKEIFTGDIVRESYEVYRTDRAIKVICPVKFYGSLLIGAIGLNNYDIVNNQIIDISRYSCEEELPFIDDDIEVIGNIWENKELLKRV